MYEQTQNLKLKQNSKTQILMKLEEEKNWQEQLDTLTPDAIYSGKRFAISQCFHQVWLDFDEF